jgi:hypothetical protein
VSGRKTGSHFCWTRSRKEPAEDSRRKRPGLTLSDGGEGSEHDPKKWKPVFGKYHAQTNNLDHDPVQLKWIMV